MPSSCLQESECTRSQECQLAEVRPYAEQSYEVSMYSFIQSCDLFSLLLTSLPEICQDVPQPVCYEWKAVLCWTVSADEQHLQLYVVSHSQFKPHQEAQIHLLALCNWTDLWEVHEALICVLNRIWENEIICSFEIKERDFNLSNNLSIVLDAVKTDCFHQLCNLDINI